jgi:hypothetical protein
MKTKTKFSYRSFKIILGFMCAMALGSKSNAQVLITWDSSSSGLGAVLTGNAVAGYQFASTAIEWEVGLWNSSVTTTDKASILSGFTSWKAQDAALYSGLVTADGQFSGSNSSAAIPTAWVGQPGSSFGIVFGRSSNTWGAFRFSNYTDGNLLGNLAAPSAPAQQAPFDLAQIGVAYVPTGTAGTFVLSGLAIDMPSFGDTDDNTAGNQYLQATNGIVLIPEPSSASLLALGMVGLVALRARRKS